MRDIDCLEAALLEIEAANHAYLEPGPRNAEATL
jgi:hypothetical protein